MWPVTETKINYLRNSPYFVVNMCVCISTYKQISSFSFLFYSLIMYISYSDFVSEYLSIVNFTPQYLIYRISRKRVNHLRTLLFLLGEGLVHFSLYSGELYHVRWNNDLVNNLYLEIKYALRRWIRLPSWQGVDLWWLISVNLAGSQCPDT